ERFVVDRRVELRCRNIGAERTADLHGPNRTAARRAAAEIIEKLAQREAECALVQSAALDISRELKRDRAAGFADAEVLIERRALVQDDRYARKRDDVVHDCRLPE